MKSWADFFSMGGYALYVWGSYVLALVAMSTEVLLLLKRRKAIRSRNLDKQK